ncbi:MAG TPA: FAD-dependent oxidoreductase [Candidatus Dormibacteraeota bacterium]|nr:FAD-dependent oxidoreductase [Candidatus Dormibacteraeota bacterium]
MSAAPAAAETAARAGGPPDYRAVSFWLETCGDDLTPRPPLRGRQEVDVAILGAGYTGLWTAYELQRREPGLRIAIVEREIAGFGASGRNGAWCAPDLNIGLDEVARRYGTAAAKATQQATYDAVDEVGRVCREEGLDGGYVRGGALHVARGDGQRAALEEGFETYVRFGFGERYRVLDAAEAAGHLRVEGAVAGLYTPDCAVIHPGRLVRNLARRVEARGATIYEGSAVTGFEPRDGGSAGLPGSRPVLRTPHGEVRAETIVLAGEAYLSGLRGLRRQLLPVYSLIVLTEPLGEAEWSEIGWAARECVSSFRLSIDYLSRTEDGRILFGGRGAPYHWGSTIKPSFDRHAPTHAMLRDMARAWFPVLRDVRFTHAWGGPLGMPRDWMPTVAYSAETGVASARGYIGHGVSTANLAGRTMADLICGQPSELTELPLVNHRSPDWEPEPLRWLGVRYVQQAFAGIDRGIDRRGRPSGRPSLARRLGRH